MSREDLERRRLLPPATRTDPFATVRAILIGLAGAIIVSAVLIGFANLLAVIA